MSALLETADGDLDLGNSLSLTITEDLSILVAQKARGILGMFLGEWFLDTTKGTPWLELVLGIKDPDLSSIRQAIVSRMLSIEGVTEVVDTLFDFDSETRHLTYNFELRLTDGSTVEIS